MKEINIFCIVAPLFIAILAITASAQNAKNLIIKNLSGEKRKICFYDITDLAGLIPKRCFTISAGEGAAEERDSDTSGFMVKIFQPGTLDNYLYTRRLPGDTATITMGKGGSFGYGRDEPKSAVTAYILKVCNKQYDQPVYFTLGFQTDSIFVAEGWWNVKKGQCTDFPVSRMLKNKWKVPLGVLPRTFYYARVFGDKPLFWKGGDADQSLCVKSGSAFNMVEFRYSPGKAEQATLCTGVKEEWVKFRTLGAPATGQQYYHLTF